MLPLSNLHVNEKKGNDSQPNEKRRSYSDASRSSNNADLPPPPANPELQNNDTNGEGHGIRDTGIVNSRDDARRQNSGRQKQNVNFNHRLTQDFDRQNSNPNQLMENEGQQKQAYNKQDKIPDTDGFIRVQRKTRHRGTRKMGTAVVDTSENASASDFVGRNYRKPEDKKLWMFISRAAEQVTADAVRNYVAKKGETDTDGISVKLLETKTRIENNRCFLVGVPLHLKEMIYEDNFWPGGICFERFNFRRGQHFLQTEKAH